MQHFVKNIICEIFIPCIFFIFLYTNITKIMHSFLTQLCSYSLHTQVHIFHFQIALLNFTLPFLMFERDSPTASQNANALIHF